MKIPVKNSPYNSSSFYCTKSQNLNMLPKYNQTDIQKQQKDLMREVVTMNFAKHDQLRNTLS